MENVLIEYRNKLSKLHKYNKRLQEIDKWAAKVELSEAPVIHMDTEALRTIRELFKDPSKRIYDYNLFIITLYGILEGFIEQLIKAYLVSISQRIEKYEDLPEIIKKNHLIFSADLIVNRSKMAKYTHISERTIIDKLQGCLQDNKSFELNVEAFTNHASNFRKDAIREIFHNIGIENITSNICKCKTMQNYFVRYEGIEESDLAFYNEDTYFNMLSELVERRNLIAHGSDVDDIFSLAILDNYIYYIEALLNSIYEICEKNMYTFIISHGNVHYLGKPICVYNNEIVCINSQYCVLKAGTIMFAQNETTQEIKYGKILSIQYQKNELVSTRKEESIDVGIKVTFYAKENWTYGIIEK